jgi:type I restriction enzyme S subunit
MIDNDSGGRCVCSDKNAELDAIFAEIEKLDEQSYQMATLGVEKLEMGDDADAAIAAANKVADSLKNGGAQPNLNAAIIKSLEIKIPSLEMQHNISDMLSAYDDLIENNQKQIKLLEEAAQRLYKEWFVDLRFPGYENTPVVDGVPQGGEEYAISDLCEKIKAGGTPSRKKANYWNNASIKWYKTQELQDCWLIDSDGKISKEGQENSSAKFFPKNTLLMAIYASPTLGRLGILDSDATCNQAALCLKADETIISWQWLYEKLYELRDHYNGIARGAGQQNISGEVVKQTIVLCPTKEIMDIFTQIVAPWFEKRRMLQKQNISLTEARDRLLPKLMSGELEV